MTNTAIEWTDKTWNPLTGCSKVSQGCKNCYAERLFPKVYPGRAFTDVRCHPNRLEAPLRWKKPRMVFVNSMSDLFHEKVPDKFIDEVFAVMGLCPQHTFQILTKRPERMREYLAEAGKRVGLAAEVKSAELLGDDPESVKPEDYRDRFWRWPIPNVWLGVSVEDQKTADERIPLLLQTPAAVRFISYEPALGPVDLGGYYLERNGRYPFPMLKEENRTKFIDLLDWVICGGESGPKARPMHPDWARGMRDQCQAAGVAFFFKQWGEWEPSFKFPEQFKGTPPTTPVLHLAHDGHIGHSHAEMEGHPHHGLMVKTGKARAGRLLDGREWNEYPTTRQVTA